MYGPSTQGEVYALRVQFSCFTYKSHLACLFKVIAGVDGQDFRQPSQVDVPEYSKLVSTHSIASKYGMFYTI